MPNYQMTHAVALDQQFRALADSGRRRMIERLASGPATVSDLAGLLDVALPTAMQHLELLTAVGLVDSQKVGRVRTVQLVPGALDGAGAWIRTQRTPAERQADRLAAHLDVAKGKEIS